MSTCRSCSAPLPPRTRAAGRVREYCDNRCWSRVNRKAVSRTNGSCDACGELITAPIARGGPVRKFCGQYCRDSYRIAHLQPRACQRCGAEYRTASRAQRYCSKLCVGRITSARQRKPPKPCPVCGTLFSNRGEHSRTYCSRECGGIGNAQLAKKHERLCGECRAPFVGSARQKFCSVRCSGKSASRGRDKRLTNRAGLERFAPREVFERDGWRCHLCGGQCDPSAIVPSPYAPTLDHVVPVSLGGEHTRSNVKCAHFRCNCRRGNKSLPEELSHTATLAIKVDEYGKVVRHYGVHEYGVL